MAIGEDGNPTVWIFNMKNRFGWRDHVENTLSLSDSEGDNVDIMAMVSKVQKELHDNTGD